ncbi:response regulator [Thiocapsa bogorovii]|uniref:response regulator n=1 Tax=Thiocapsa bogorovii TaxID=521689 RepID=UPI001E46A28A|nr:response regulator transcription factor [Thiocapsa bogorovii]UHD18661.1 response regulator transcription factor [Thiocapsa bogorovii]
MPAKILLCDDHTLVREGLAALLRQRTDWTVVAEAADGREAVELAARLQPDVVLMDVAMPRMSGTEAAAAIHEAAPATRIVALSMFGDAMSRRGMFEAGALAYVLKNNAATDLFAAIDGALRGETYLSPALAEPTARSDTGATDPEKIQLTGRERDVLRLLAEGRRTRDIATEIGISPKTVETYRSRIVHKLRIESLAGLVKYAIRAGIVRG